MPKNFYDFVDSEIRRALPSDCRQVPSDELLGEDAYKIRYAFHTRGDLDKSRLVNILVLPESFQLNKYIEEQLIRLRDHILSKKGILVIISEDEHADSLKDVGCFIADCLANHRADILWLHCGRDKGYRTTIEDDPENLRTVIRDLWKGILRYVGPRTGLQQVNLEIMQDECLKCHRQMRTVTGIVFPDRHLSRWDNSDWQYYNHLISLAQLTGSAAEVIQHEVRQLRDLDPLVTPVRIRFSQTEESDYLTELSDYLEEQCDYLAAGCPHCDALRGDLYIRDYRMRYMHSFDSRSSGELHYHPLPLEVDSRTLATLWDGSEGYPQVCWAGWSRLPAPFRLGKQQRN